MRIKFDTTKRDAIKIIAIAKRAVKMAEAHGVDYSMLTADMDLTACHLNGCELDLDKLLTAPDFDFAHDVFGIRRHIDRNTGQLQDCFLPRCTVGNMADNFIGEDQTQGSFNRTV